MEDIIEDLAQTDHASQRALIRMRCGMDVFQQ
jgi:hypothetical protein